MQIIIRVSEIMDVAQCIEICTEQSETVQQEPVQQQVAGQQQGAGPSAHQQWPGQNAFVAPVGLCQFENPLQNPDSEFVVYHKKFVGLVTPFDLPIECFPEFESMLEEDPDCVDTVNIMLRGAVAKSTASN